MQKIDAVKERRRKVGAAKAQIRAAIGQEASLAAWCDQRDERSGRARVVCGKPRIDAVGGEKRRLAFAIGRAHPPGETRRNPLARKPAGLVRAGAAGKQPDRCAHVGADCDRTVGPDDDIRHHVADDEDARHAVRQCESRVSATAILAASAALFLISAMFGRSVRPPLAA